MSRIRITAPDAPAGDWHGPADIVFTDGVTELDTDRYPTMAAYAARHGYTVEPAGDAPTETPDDNDDGDADVSTWSKQDLADYLTAHSVPFTTAMNKADLAALAEQHRAEDIGGTKDEA